MKFKRIHIRGYRSYSDEGIELTGLGNTNLIIGPNSSGKSNLFRAFRRVINNLPDTIKKFYARQNNIKKGQEIFLAFKTDKSILKKFKSQTSLKLDMKVDTLKPNDFWDKKKQTFSIEVEYIDGIIITIICNYRGRNNQSMHITGTNGSAPLTMDYIIPKLLFLYTSTVVIGEVRSYDTDINGSLSNDIKLDNQLALTLREHFFSLDDNPISGTKFKSVLEKGLKEILLEDYKIFRDPSIKKIDNFNPGKHLILKINRAGVITSSTLQDVGSGIGQILLFISVVYSYLNYKDKRYDNYIKFLIEEPEQHFHPEAMIRLFQYLHEISDNRTQFIINTHTPWLIDHEMVDQIYKVQMSQNGSTNFHKAFEENKNEIRNLLDLLGIRSSQFLQSNMVIWVEGPSDRIYIKKWLNLMLKKLRDENSSLPHELIEGKHFSFFMYGGSLLKYYSYDEEFQDSESTFINLLSTSRYAALVCDTDNVDGELKEALQRWLSILRDEKYRDFVIPWKTEGKEIENYIPQNMLYTVLKDFRKEVIVKREELSIVCEEKEQLRIPIKMKDPSKTGHVFKQGQSFATFFSDIMVYDLSTVKDCIKGKLEKEMKIKDECNLIEKHKKRVRTTFNSKKAKIALEVVKIMDDLPSLVEEDIKNLLIHILKANNIKG